MECMQGCWRWVVRSLSLCVLLLGISPLAAPVAMAGTVQAETPAAAQVVNINTADAEALAAVLVGVGPAKAQAIVEYRKQYGLFKSADELLEVKGIGQSLLDKNRSRIVLK